ncbi:MAG: fibronectin type III domain-containing protein [Solirubrobacteraceae bacterium]
MSRRIGLGAIAAVAICALMSSAAQAAPTQLVLSQGAAFSLLGHSCGGIQERVYATGFGPDGYPTGDVYMQTRCGGSGKGGGYKVTTYSAWASVAWTWFGETRSFALLQGAASENPSFSATDAYGDHIYNSGSVAYLEVGEPPLQPPAPPTEVSVGVGLFEAGETEYLRMTVTWTAAAETADLISSSTVTATPVGSSAPVLSATASGTWSTAYLSPVQPNTTYRVTVTSTDSEGTSQTSAPVEVRSPNQDGEAERELKTVQTCESSQGTIKLSPGLSEVPHVQNITVKGQFSGCGGPLGFESATFVDHLKTTEEVTCSVLASASSEPTTAAVSLAVKWNEGGSSKGSLLMPLSEVAATGLSGTLEHGPFATPTTIQTASIGESFTGSATCGQASGKKAAKLVKAGVFSTGEVEFG